MTWRSQVTDFSPVLGLFNGQPIVGFNEYPQTETINLEI